MNKQPFNNAKEFLKNFNLGEGSPYSQPTILTDRKVGFSVQREYPTDIRYSPAKTKKGEDDTVALIHIVYTHPSELDGAFDPQKVPIIVRIGVHSLYHSKHFDYDFDDPDCPTEESLRVNKSTRQPIGLNFIGDFFFDHEKEKFVNQTNELLSGNQLLDQIFTEHCNTVHLLKGLRYRFQLKKTKLQISIISHLINLIRWSLKNIFGRTLDESNAIRSSLKGYKKTDLQRNDTESLKIFEYRTSRNLILYYFLFVVLVSIGWWFFGPEFEYFRYIFDHSFLIIPHVILPLAFLDLIFPKILFGILNYLIKWRAKVSFR
jgi:hypothetical protein